MASRTRAARYAKRRKNRMAKRDHDLTDEQWADLQEAWNGCAYCGATGVPFELLADLVLLDQEAFLVEFLASHPTGDLVVAFARVA